MEALSPMFSQKRHAFRCTLASFLLSLFVLMPSALFAQQSGTINGSVTDESGSAVPGAQIVLTNANQGTKLNVTSNASGEYTFPSLEAGTYNLEVTASGF